MSGILVGAAIYPSVRKSSKSMMPSGVVSRIQNTSNSILPHVNAMGV